MFRINLYISESSRAILCLPYFSADADNYIRRRFISIGGDAGRIRWSPFCENRRSLTGYRKFYVYRRYIAMISVIFSKFLRSPILVESSTEE